MSEHRPQITVIHGGLGGAEGNTSAIARPLVTYLQGKVDVREVHLVSWSDPQSLKQLLSSSDGFVFTTGTYWDSWGSPLQKFLEDFTEFEATDLWQGKPACVLVTMHSVGGKEVLSRLQGVLSTLGALIPPMSGMTYSLANHLALQTPKSDFHADLWQQGDLQVIGHNLLRALGVEANWKTWPVDDSDPFRRWFYVQA